MASKHVAGLEAEVGVKLLSRTTRQLSLTEAGLTLNRTAITLFGLLETAEQDIRASTTSPRGTLRVNAPMSFGVLHLGRTTVSDFLKQCPDVVVELTLDDRTVNVVEEGYGIAIRIRRLDDSSLIAKHLAPAGMVTCPHRPTWSVGASRSTRTDLKHQDCLVYDYLSRHGTWSFERDGVRVDGRLGGNNGEVLMQDALDGHGITLSPTFIAHEALRAGTLKPVLCDWSVVEPAFFAVMPPGRKNVLKVRTSLDHLSKAFGRDPYWDRNLPMERFRSPAA